MPGVHVRDGPKPTQHGGGMHQDVEPAMPLVDGEAKLVDSVAIAQVERNQCRALAG